MKRTILTSVIAGAALVGAQAAVAAEPAGNDVNAYLVESGLLSAPVTPDTVGVAATAAPNGPTEAYLVRSGLIEPRTRAGAPADDTDIALEPGKRYLLEIDSTNYVEVIESLPRG